MTRSLPSQIIRLRQIYAGAPRDRRHIINRQLVLAVTKQIKRENKEDKKSKVMK